LFLGTLRCYQRNVVLSIASGPGNDRGVAYLLPATYIMTMTQEEERLIELYSEEAFRGRTIRQEDPTCECGKAFDQKHLCEAPAVFFKELELFGKTFHLIEPVCPICKRKIPANFYVLN
jgi:hypothetical protein